MDNKKQNPQDIDPVTLGDTDLWFPLQSLREMLTEKGEYSTQAEINNDKDATVKRGIPYYQMALDSLANEFCRADERAEPGPGRHWGRESLYEPDNPGDKITAVTLPSQRTGRRAKVHMLSSPQRPLRPLQPGQIPRGILQRAPD